jgi:phage gpG-like protein
VARGVDILLEPPIEFILRQTGRFRLALLDFTGLWELFKPVMADIEQQQFDTQGHGSWPPLAESTLRYKTGTMMRETDALYNSLVNADQAMHIEGPSAWYGTDVEYAHWHQTGGTIPGRPPIRQVIPDPLPVDARQKLETAQIVWINAVAAETFGRI